jgi:c-di-GMP-binding flagellar brake protein YcgR
MAKLALLDHLDQSRRILVDIPLKEGGSRTFHATGQLRDRDKRTVVAELLDQSVPPAEEINFRERCTVSLNTEGPALSMFATIEEVLGERKLLLMGTDFVPYQPKRNTFRVDTEIPVSFKRYFRDEESFREARSIDLSSGGVRICCPEDLHNGEVLTLCIEIPGASVRCVPVTAQVVWTGKLTGGYWSVGCKFLDLDEASEDTIIGYCFERQREIMKERVQVADSRRI